MIEKATGMPPGQALQMDSLVDYQEDSVVSRTLIKTSGGTVTLFSFDKGQELSEHTAPFDAIVDVLDGEAALVIGGNKVQARMGQSVLMPANISHAVLAPERFKMLLTMVRDPKQGKN